MPNCKVRYGPSGVHIFDRLTGLNILFEEVQLDPTLWAAAPRQVSIALTNSCDLTCTHCFAPKTRATLKLDLLKKWLDELDENGCLGVGFGGGEPTLYPHFLELCNYTAYNTSLAVTFTTHGHHLDEEMLGLLQGNVHFVRVSMDGVGTRYEIIRRRSFNSLLNLLHKIKFIAPFGINYLVNKYTMPDLNHAISIAEDVGSVEFLLLPEQPVNGRGGIDPETLQALNGWIETYQGTIPLTISELSANVQPLCNPLPKESGILSFAHIDATGIIKKTSYDQYGVKIESDGVIAALSKL